MTATTDRLYCKTLIVHEFREFNKTEIKEREY